MSFIDILVGSNWTWNVELKKKAFETNILGQWFPTFFCSRTPWLALMSCFVENLSVILKLMIILRPPWDFSSTPGAGGTRTPGWKPLLYVKRGEDQFHLSMKVLLQKQGLSNWKERTWEKEKKISAIYYRGHFYKTLSRLYWRPE